MSLYTGLLQRRSLPFQWAVLLTLSALLTMALEAAELPASLLLGPMAAGILVALAGGRAAVPDKVFLTSQSTVGCLIASAITVPILLEVIADWPIFLAGVVVMVGASATMGWTLTRMRILPGTTAIWGSWSGGASAMVLMADDFGADMRLVAVMQYLRVALVALVASLVAGMWTSGGGHPVTAAVWFPQLHMARLLPTLALMAAGVLITARWRVPAGGVLVTMVLAALAQDLGLLELELPQWLLAMGYACLGWGIGLRFTPGIIRHGAKALPRITAAIVALILVCGVFAAVLTLVADIDPLTAYLATCPGGSDSVAVIAASTDVDMPFVMAMQVIRFLAVLFAGPFLSRRMAAAGRL